MPAERVNVVVSSRTLVRAFDPPQGFPTILQPSILDLILSSFHIYLGAFLSCFFPFASRVVANTDNGVPKIDCDNADVELKVVLAGVRHRPPAHGQPRPDGTAQRVDGGTELLRTGVHRNYVVSATDVGRLHTTVLPATPLHRLQ